MLITLMPEDIFVIIITVYSVLQLCSSWCSDSDLPYDLQELRFSDVKQSLRRLLEFTRSRPAYSEEHRINSLRSWHQSNRRSFDVAVGLDGVSEILLKTSFVWLPQDRGMLPRPPSSLP